MGLDMYLTARKYISGWRNDEDGNAEYDHLVAEYGMKEFVTDQAPSAYVEFNIGYWRKANAIHGWFVNNVQDGKDECLPHYVPREKLEELRSICQDLLLTKERYGQKLAADRAMELLEPTEGFFFGVYDINERYWEALERTVAIINRALSIPNDHFDWDFQYRSSW